MYAALQAAGVESELVIIPGGDHGFTRTEDRARAEQLMVAWFDRLLGTGQ
jgi:dipeptidyl aminopeptidase/acylaminoacyl peptidase